MNQSNSTAKQSHSADAIQTYLVSLISEQLGVAPDYVDIREPFDSYGLDSAQAMIIVSKVERLLGFELSPLLLLHYPTIEALAQRLAEESEVSESEIFEI
ncbi:MAG: acyl carrier protein [Chroococcidiopsidaceae cyanobacterium CP_BM_ER_R8_30]|nr:acyl carrier protein [Chroococcidiopsidaceae cyanobacterium CP_BM_ER_R8_30]